MMAHVKFDMGFLATILMATVQFAAHTVPVQRPPQQNQKHHMDQKDIEKGRNMLNSLSRKKQKQIKIGRNGAKILQVV